jgi:hypothetical protein
VLINCSASHFNNLKLYFSLIEIEDFCLANIFIHFDSVNTMNAILTSFLSASNEKMDLSFEVMVAGAIHIGFAAFICKEMEMSALKRGIGIAKRSEAYIQQKMLEGKAIIAFSSSGVWAGFSFIESWDNEQFVSNSGLIVASEFRNSGLARMIKKAIFRLSRDKFPQAKIFGMTSSQAVLKINSELGFQPVTYAQLPLDPSFWESCRSCVNYEILIQKEKKICFCTAMKYGV